MRPSIPHECLDYLVNQGTFEGFTSGEPGYVVLWAEDEIDGNNADIRIDAYAPGFVAFAGNGGGEVLVFDSAGAVFMLPMIGMEGKYAIKIADSFAELSARFEVAAD